MAEWYSVNNEARLEKAWPSFPLTLQSSTTFWGSPGHTGLGDSSYWGPYQQLAAATRHMREKALRWFHPQPPFECTCMLDWNCRWLAESSQPSESQEIIMIAIVWEGVCGLVTDTQNSYQNPLVKLKFVLCSDAFNFLKTVPFSSLKFMMPNADS